jgi:hypothetical protein
MAATSSRKRARCENRKEAGLCYHVVTRPGGFGPAPIRPAVLAAGLLIAQQVAGKATRDAFFLSQFDVTSLPLMGATSALLSLLAVLAFSRGMAALSPALMVPLAMGASAALLTGEWLLSGPFPRLAAVAVYLHTALFGATLVSGFWSLVNERFDPYSAKRAVGPIGTGASLGGTIGGLVTWRAATAVTVPTMLLAMAALNVLCLAPLLLLRPTKALRGGRGGETRTVPENVEALAGSSGLQLIRAFPYLRNLALVVGLCAFVEALVDYVFNAGAKAAFPKGQALMAFFALFYTIVGLLSLVVQATLARASLARLGLPGTLAVQPALVALGGLLVISFPRFWTTILLRGSQAVLRNSLFRSAYELLYTPLPRERKRPTKVIVDVGFDRLGTAAGSGAVMVVLSLTKAMPDRVLIALAAATGGLTLALLPRFQRGYVDALAENLRISASDSTHDAAPERRPAPASVERHPAPSPPARPDPLVEATSDLHSGDPERIGKVLRRDETLDPRLVSQVIPLLAQDDLFADVVSALRTAAPRCTGQLLDALLDPALDVVVRRRIPRVLKATPTQRAADGLLLGLRDARFDIRYRCTEALVKLREQNTALGLPRQEIIAAALREIETGRPGGRSLDHVFSILSLLLEREPLVIALRVLRMDDQALRGTALEYLDNVLPDPVREKLWPQLGSPERPAPSGRSTEEIRDSLLRATASMALRQSTGRKR